MELRNVHERAIDAPAEQVGRLLDGLGRDDDRLWPAPAWAPMLFDRPMQVGADGGHGDIRYRVSEYEPGRRVRFEFRPATGLSGWHELTVEPHGDRCRLRHTLIATPRGWMRLLVPLAIRALHDAVVEDLLDNAEREAAGRVERPARWSPWVRMWRRILREGATVDRRSQPGAPSRAPSPAPARPPSA